MRSLVQSERKREAAFAPCRGDLASLVPKWTATAFAKFPQMQINAGARGANEGYGKLPPKAIPAPPLK